jgi:hypothetical protein
LVVVGDIFLTLRICGVKLRLNNNSEEACCAVNYLIPSLYILVKVSNAYLSTTLLTTTTLLGNDKSSTSYMFDMVQTIQSPGSNMKVFLALRQCNLFGFKNGIYKQAHKA